MHVAAHPECVYRYAFFHILSPNLDVATWIPETQVDVDEQADDVLSSVHIPCYRDSFLPSFLIHDSILLQVRPSIPADHKAHLEVHAAFRGEAVRFVLGMCLPRSSISHPFRLVCKENDDCVCLLETAANLPFVRHEGSEYLCIPAFQSLPWKADPRLLVFRAAAVWRTDLFADGSEDAARWRTVAQSLNVILQSGDVDEFFQTWRIHHTVHANPGAKSAALPLSDIHSVMRRFFFSGAFDPNSGAHMQVVETAMPLVRQWMRTHAKAEVTAATASCDATRHVPQCDTSGRN
eukprot:gene11804-13287_t